MSLTPRLADELVRRLAAAFRAAQLYAPTHPLAARNVGALGDTLTQLHASVASIAIGIVGDNLVVGDTPIPRAAENMGELMRRRPGMLSGGQRQRVAIGRAMVREPVVYLMDQPLSNLDAKLRVSMRAELARLHDRLGVTTVYVTHDQTEAMTLGDRVCVMLDGVIQQVDTPGRLYREPANAFVAGFIGSPSMNLAIAEVAGEELVVGGHRLALSAEQRARVGPR